LTRKLERVVSALKRLEGSSPRGGDRNWKGAVDARLEGRAARGVSAGPGAGTIYIPERLDAGGLGVEKVRCGLGVASARRSVRADAHLRALKRAQDLLGRMHDLQVLTERVRQVQASLTPPNIAVWRELDALMMALDNDCRRLHARYMRTRDDLVAIAARLA